MGSLVDASDRRRYVDIGELVRGHVQNTQNSRFEDDLRLVPVLCSLSSILKASTFMQFVREPTKRRITLIRVVD